MDFRKKTGRGFTLIEMVVAVGLIVMIFAFSGAVFKASIASHRTATAQAEIMQRFRAITDQLNSDFAGLRKDAPMFIWFELDPNSGRRFDQIMFFADGDFQSAQPYALNVSGVRVPSYRDATGSTSGLAPVVSNVARVYYGQAVHYNYNAGMVRTRGDYTIFNTLSRRQHLFTADPTFAAFPAPFPPPSSPISAAAYVSNFISSFTVLNENGAEHDRLALSEWQTILGTDTFNSPANGYCLDAAILVGLSRPLIDLAEPNGFRLLHTLLSQSVSSFSIQWGYRHVPLLPPVNERYYWWPSRDPDGNLTYIDSDFAVMVSNYPLQISAIRPAFGVHFNTANPNPMNPVVAPYWFSAGDARYYYPPAALVDFPSALCFTMTIHDSKGVIKNGQTFTHIIDLDK